MDYSLIAGSLVTLALFLLFVETQLNRRPEPVNKIFVILYSLGVGFWLALGISMNQAALVLISIMQLLFLTLSAQTKAVQDDK